MKLFNRIASNSSPIRGSLLALVMVLLSAWAMAGPEDADSPAKIITSHEKPAECISSVHVNAIDGELVYVQPLGFDLEPGKHSLTARAVINTAFCKVLGPSVGKDKTPPLEADFEAGKTYYIGLDHSSSSRKDWRLVIWKVDS
ncbi:MAG: hypothetical protein SH820_00075 [Xanthomonadales bacterium]|nr:hypothetical protein [Xanthomonadales bacterium]